MTKNHLTYLTCNEVAERLGLGKRRRCRRTRSSQPLRDEERRARPVRQLIQSGKLKAIKLDNGEWRVREDWLEQYEATLLIRAEKGRIARLEKLCGQSGYTSSGADDKSSKVDTTAVNSTE